MPSSQARRRTAGEAIGLSPAARVICWRAGGAGARWRGLAVRARAAALTAGAAPARSATAAGAAPAPPCGAAAGAAAAAAGAAAGAVLDVARALDLDADQLRADRHHLPDLAAERQHLAGTGDGISTVALSVITSASDLVFRRPRRPP